MVLNLIENFSKISFVIPPNIIEHISRGIEITNQSLELNDLQLYKSKVWLLENSQNWCFYGTTPEKVWNTCVMNHGVTKVKILVSFVDFLSKVPPVPPVPPS